MSVENQRIILAVPSSRLPESTKETTFFLPMPEEKIWETLHMAGLWLGPRATLEEMPVFRQIIPYVALVVDGKVIKYTRTPSGGEARLHGKVSIGLGGHVDIEDIRFEHYGINLVQTLEDAAAREVLEEIGPVEVISKQWVGLVAANNNPVDFVHIGVVAVWVLAQAPTGVVEDALEKVSLSTLEDLQSVDHDRTETWSQLLIEHLVNTNS